MPGADLKINVGVDVTQLITGLNQAQNKLDEFKKAAQDAVITSAFNSAIKTIGQLENEISALNNAIKNTSSVTELKALNDQLKKLESQANNLKVVGFQTSLHKIEGSAKNATAALAKVGPGGSDKATNALTNLSRVVQDAPFGFIGIANNINPLLESFQRLQKESGSTGGALKALVGGLAGAGGLGLAVGIGSAALSLFGMAMQKSGTEAKKAEEKIDEYGKTVESIAGKIGEQVANVDVLVKAYERENLTQGQRVTIIKELKQLAPEYFNQLKEEKTNIDQLTVAYAAFTASIERAILAEIKRARLKDLLQRKIQLSVDLNLTEPDTKLDALFDELPKNAKKAIDATKSVIRKNPFGKDMAVPEIENSAIVEYKAKLAEINRINKEAFDIEMDLAEGLVVKEPDADKVKKIKEKLLKPFRKIVFKEDDFGFFDEATIKMQVPVEAELNFKKSLNPGDPLGGLNGILSPQALEEVNIKSRLAGLGISSAIQDGVKTGLEGLRFPNLKALDDFYKQIDEANTRATESLKTTFQSAFASIGESIADSLGSSASFGQIVFGNLFKVLGAGLKQLGEAMIGIGTAKIALEKFKFAPGVGTVIAGIAAVALGALLQKAIPGFAGGVTGYSGGLALVGERGPELVRLPRGSDVIPNHQLNNMAAGNGVQVFIPAVTLRGSDLVVAFSRASQTISRNG